MQLNWLVLFHKTIGNPTRIRIIALLSKQLLALGLKPPTITHHIAKLRGFGLIREKREGNNS